MYIERKIVPPCQDCITISMCMHRAHELQEALSTNDCPVVIVRALMPMCPPLTEFIHSHPQHHCEYETPYMSQVIELMKLEENYEDFKAKMSV